MFVAYNPSLAASRLCRKRNPSCRGVEGGGIPPRTPLQNNMRNLSQSVRFRQLWAALRTATHGYRSEPQNGDNPEHTFLKTPTAKFEII